MEDLKIGAKEWGETRNGNDQRVRLAWCACWSLACDVKKKGMEGEWFKAHQGLSCGIECLLRIIVWVAIRVGSWCVIGLHVGDVGYQSMEIVRLPSSECDSNTLVVEVIDNCPLQIEQWWQAWVKSWD